MESLLRSEGATVAGTGLAAAAAVGAVAAVLRSSLGPLGANKLLVDRFGRVTVTSDGASILRAIELDHPAAELLRGLANAQERAVGDGTSSVVLLAARLIELLRPLTERGWPLPALVAALAGGLEEAREASRQLARPASLEDRRATVADALGEARQLAGPVGECVELAAGRARSLPELRRLVHVVRTVSHGSARVLHGLAVTARSVLIPDSSGEPQPAAVLLLDHLGGSIAQARLALGRVASAGRPLAVFVQQPVDAARLAALVDLTAGALMLVAGLSSHLMERVALECGTVCLSEPAALRSSSQACARPLGQPDGWSQLGSAEHLALAEPKTVLVRGSGGAVSLLIAGGSPAVADQLARCADDALGVAWACRAQPAVVCGGGGGGCAGAVLECLAGACEAIPQALARNAGVEDTPGLVCLIQQTQAERQQLTVGIDGLTGELDVECELVELLEVKLQALERAVRAACTLIRVDLAVAHPRAEAKLRRAPAAKSGE